MINVRTNSLAAFAVILGAALLLPPVSHTADLDKGLIEVGQILDGIFNSHFRRSMRAQAALQECDLDERPTNSSPLKKSSIASHSNFRKKFLLPNQKI